MLFFLIPLHTQLRTHQYIRVGTHFPPAVFLQLLIHGVPDIRFSKFCTAVFLSAFFFKFVAYLLDPITNYLGRTTLESESLRPLYTIMYNMPLVPLTRFNNSIVMGSALLGFSLAIPLFFVFKFLILKYRELIVARLKNSKWWKAFKATALVKLYDSYSKLYL